MIPQWPSLRCGNMVLLRAGSSSYKLDLARNRKTKVQLYKTNVRIGIHKYAHLQIAYSNVSVYMYAHIRSGGPVAIPDAGN